MEQDFYCKNILSGKIKYKVVEETNNILAFHHTKPSYKMHIVVIPKNHIVDLVSVSDLEIIKEIFEVILKIIKNNKLIDFKIINNSGKYQDSKHLHFHLISNF